MEVFVLTKKKEPIKREGWGKRETGYLIEWGPQRGDEDGSQGKGKEVHLKQEARLCLPSCEDKKKWWQDRRECGEEFSIYSHCPYVIEAGAIHRKMIKAGYLK